MPPPSAGKRQAVGGPVDDDTGQIPGMLGGQDQT